MILVARSTFSAACLALIFLGISPQATAVDFNTTVRPIIESACLRCHHEDNAEGELRLDSRQAALAGGARGAAIVPGKPSESTFYTWTRLPEDHDDFMPPEGPPLAPVQIAQLKEWIEQGADWPEGVELQIQSRIDFVTHVQPILEQNCLGCHGAEEPDAEYSLVTRDGAFESGENAPSLVAFQPQASPLYILTLLEDDADRLMPPADQGDRLSEAQQKKLRLWISQGAVWPVGLELQQKARYEAPTDTPDNMDLVRKIHASIVENARPTAESEMVDYQGAVPLTKALYHMVALSGGEYLMGSPAGEPGRAENEGPETRVRVAPFWIGKYEVSWDEYEPFMITQVDRRKNGARQDYDPEVHTLVDAVSQPTPPYMEMSFGMGQYGYPAISMTQHAANKYCQWLSAQTAHFYRLATEAEWEFACRAGTTTAYSFGDDPQQLGDYGWYYENSDGQYRKVGQKKPNRWGLHDMHGNVMEWTADQFVPDYFLQIQQAPRNPFLKPESLYPRSVRGGGWDDDPELLRSAARRGSTDVWKQQDPQLPKSIWYHTDAQWLGFRIVRPLKVPSVEEMYFYWNSAVGKM